MSYWRRWSRHAWRLLIAGVLLALFLLTVGIAHAHAVLERSIPADGAVLDTAPTELQLWFSEPVEMTYSQVYLLDSAGKRMGSGRAVRPGPGDPTLLIAPLDPLRPGVYTVVWQVVSTTDGHPTAGAFAFAVGRDQVPPGGVRPVSTGIGIDGASLLTELGITAKWLAYLSMATIVGGSSFFLLAGRQAIPLRQALDPEAGNLSGEASPAQNSTRASPGNSSAPLFAVVLAGWVLTLVITLLGALAQSAINAGTGPAAALGPSPVLPLAGRQGALYGMRFLLVSILAVPILRGRVGLRRRGVVQGWVWWACLGLGGLVLLFLSLGSHAAAGAQPIFNIAVDWLHLMAASIWAGGLLMLFLSLVRAHRTEGFRSAAVSRLVGRFSRLATVCVMTLIVTGIIRAVDEVGDWDNLTDTAYGTDLLIKLGLLVVLLGLAAANLLLIGPRLAMASRSTGSPPADLSWHSHLRRTVGGEVMVVAALLLVTGILSTTQPGRDAFGPGVVVRARGDDLRAVLVIKSDDPEARDFDVYLRDGAGGPLADADKVALIFTTAGESRLEIESEADNQLNGHYLARGKYLSMMDKRKVQLLVRRSGRDDVRLILDISKMDSP
ncbi:MAG: copper resistance protein CopC/CopD [Chloroflexi bacterium]|nr:copper resistance protein CopC/CopD [Chloroflexota bacterium]